MVMQVGSQLLAIGASVPIGVSGAILIGGTNNMTTNQKMGARWEVRDPDGVVVDSYYDWEMFWTGPGLEQGFVGNRFDLDKPGTYTVKADLLMNLDNPVTVDSYEGDLCVVTTEVPPEYELIQHTIYPWAYTFEGEAETCIFEFKLLPEQVPGIEWFGDRIVDAFVSKLEEEGSRLLELKVYEDTTPTFWTNYRVEVTATASPIAWTPIIIGVLAIMFIVAIYFTIKLVDEVFFKRKPLDEATKKTFSRETLIAMILDLAPETRPETLEGISDEELRNLLNRILVEEAPPVSLWPLAILGGLGVLGVGAAVALSATRRE